MLLGTLIVAANVAACDFGERHPEAPVELEQYAFLVGNHTVRAWRWDPENQNWGRGYLETQWNGWWALDGFAIADEWFDVQFPGQPTTYHRGINLRMWNAEAQRWSNMVDAYQHGNHHGTPFQDGRRENGDVSGVPRETQ